MGRGIHTEHPLALRFIKNDGPMNEVSSSIQHRLESHFPVIAGFIAQFASLLTKPHLQELDILGFTCVCIDEHGVSETVYTPQVPDFLCGSGSVFTAAPYLPLISSGHLSGFPPPSKFTLVNTPVLYRSPLEVAFTPLSSTFPACLSHGV